MYSRLSCAFNTYLGTEVQANSSQNPSAELVAGTQRPCGPLSRDRRAVPAGQQQEALTLGRGPPFPYDVAHAGAAGGQSLLMLMLMLL